MLGARHEAPLCRAPADARGRCLSELIARPTAAPCAALPTSPRPLFVVGAIAAAQTILAFSLPLLAFELSGAGTGLALIKGAGFVPNILFAVFVGVLNDRTLKATAFRRYTLGLAAHDRAALCRGPCSSGCRCRGLVLFMVVFNGLAYATSNAQMTLIRLAVPQAHLSDATALTSTVLAVVTTAGAGGRGAHAPGTRPCRGDRRLRGAPGSHRPRRPDPAPPRRRSTRPGPSCPRSPRVGGFCAPTASSAR